MSPDPRSLVLAACRQLLRPIVRLLLRYGVMQRDFSELCKEVFVEVATREYGLQGRPTNVSRTALLTGLDRKEVRRIRELLDATVDDSQSPSRQDRLTRVLSGWHQDPEFSRDGVPLELPMAGLAAEASFTALVQRYGGDVPAVALLKELKRAGAVAEQAERLRALTRYYMPAATDAAALQRAGGVLEDLGNTVVHNLLPAPREPQPRFEGRATNPTIAPAALPEFRELLEQRGQAFLEEIDAWLTAHEAAPDDATPRLRLGVGIYGIQDPPKKTE